MLNLFKKKVQNSEISEKNFECQRDGLTIRGTEYRPVGENLPIAIVSHGFMAFQDTVRHYAKLFAELGFVSYCFDFCGGSVIKGKSDGKTTEMSVLTEVKDLEVVIEYAKSLPYTNACNVTLMGCSQGGFVSALVAAKQKEKIAKLVLFYPALCIPDDARAGKMMFAKFDPNNIPEIVNCGPMKLGRCYVADVISMDPYAEIREYPGKVLIVHGTKDKIVKWDYAKRAYQNYLKNNSAGLAPEQGVTLRLIEDGAHGFSKKHDKMAMEEIKKFVNR